jgi:small-conductance mechanosensitive channel
MRKMSIYSIVFVLLSIIFCIWYYIFDGRTVIGLFIYGNQIDNIVISILSIAILIIVYKIGIIIIKTLIIKTKGTGGEIVMIKGVFQFFIILLAIIIIAATWTSIGTLGTLFIAFGGMFLGWSLQGPISGMAAWLLVSIARPFRVGDRVQLPSYALVGDIVSISPLYTTLNQVGGSVGSEEPANRTILIPNAMLFSSLVINYTPKNQNELIKNARSIHNTVDACESAYMLDEFVLRLSFDSDWDEAEKILLNVAKEVTADIIKKTGQEPYLRADFGDWYAVFLRLRFMTLATERPRVIYEISKRVFKEIQHHPNVDLGIPYIYSYHKGNQWAPANSIEKLDPNPDRIQILKRIKPDEKVI